MRLTVSLAFAALLLPASDAGARAFRQTYGATVPTPGGCAWNINQDYFVPRHCDSCRYDLFSDCKTAHTRSPACRHLHPVHHGYCTPFGPCRYRWRDHVYKKYCGCTPLRHTYGPWRLDKCRKHSLVLRRECQGFDEGCPVCATAEGLAVGPCSTRGDFAACRICDGCLPNVEPMGGETLGTLQTVIGAAPISMPGSAGAGQPTSTALPAPAGLPFGFMHANPAN